MFNNQRYLSHGVSIKIPFELQMIMWGMTSELSEPKDYLQIFRLSASEQGQKIIHEQEEPEYRKEYFVKTRNAVNAKVYIIDDGDYSTMLLAEEY